MYNVIDFLIVAFTLFLVVKFMNKAKDVADKKLKKEKEKEEAKEEAKPSKEDEMIKLLKDISSDIKKLNKKN